MRIIVDRDRCIGAGQCVWHAEEVFDQGEQDGIVLLRVDRPAPSQRAAVATAVERCPSGAIRLERE